MGGAYRAALETARAEGCFGYEALAMPEAAEAADRVDRRQADGRDIWPRPADLFAAWARTPRDSVRVVIVGQDPYPTPGDAHGLAFSYVGNGPQPASLRNILAELATDVGRKRDRGDLTDWADQGVLLLNAVLTVEAGVPGSHRELGWETITRRAILDLSLGPRPLAFVLWGRDARRHAAVVNGHDHLVIASPHPSPLSARRGFFGSRPFSRINAWLAARGEHPIAWVGGTEH